MLNGRTYPDPLKLRAGTSYRLRLINIRSDHGVEVALLAPDGQPAQWRRVAKDGADLPRNQATAVPARLLFSAGEIYDMEFTPAAGEYRLRFGYVPRFRPDSIEVQKPVEGVVRVR